MKTEGETENFSFVDCVFFEQAEMIMEDLGFNVIDV